MSVQVRAPRLEALIAQVTALDELAQRVQVDDFAAGRSAAAELSAAYDIWFTDCLPLLPSDLCKKFRFEYEGNVAALRYRIRHFLHEPVRPRPKLFGGGNGKPSEFTGILGYWQHPYNDRFKGPIGTQRKLLMEALSRLNSAAVTPAPTPTRVDTFDLLERLTRRMPEMYAVLANCGHGQTAVRIQNEYDVQRVLHAVAMLHFDDVRVEEPTPSVASGSSRLDFLLKDERVAVETKYMRPDLTTKRVREQLANDILYFRAHPDVDALFIYIYDPKRRITNPRGFERDLAELSESLRIRVVVAT